jgi:hypothetical protein
MELTDHLVGIVFVFVRRLEISAYGVNVGRRGRRRRGLHHEHHHWADRRLPRPEMKPIIESPANFSSL